MIRTLKTYCVYDAVRQNPVNFCATKKAAMEVLRSLKVVRGGSYVLVPMQGTYAYSPPAQGGGKQVSKEGA